jgi:hypothetical protein
MKRLKGITFVTFLCSFLLMACSREEWGSTSDMQLSEAVFKLYDVKYGTADLSRAESLEESRYDRLEFYIVDDNGERIKDVKGKYNATTSEILVEGLHEGDYRLLVLGIKGDESLDRAEIFQPEHITDSWLRFPENLQKPLEAEYFYSQTPFEVRVQQGEGGKEEIVSIRQDIRQQRIMGRLDFSFDYVNPYIRYAVLDKNVAFDEVHFYTTLSGDGAFSGSSDGILQNLNLDKITSYKFLPVSDGKALSGKISMRMRSYQGDEVSQDYGFSQESIDRNHIHSVETEVRHPDDQSVVMFLTKTAYDAGKYAKILQDDERKEVYADPSQRKFNTSRPLQLSVTEEGKLHVRFYSPRDLGDVLLKVRIPAVSTEYFDMAYFDTIPGFADFYEVLPLVQRPTVCRTESGRQIQIPQLEASQLADAEFKVESADPYWAKLQKIVHGWNIYWGLYNGDPDREDGGPSGNWMGIRPVHCRESVALFLNFTYMIDMPEHEQILRDNAEKLYDDNKNPIKVEQVLQQMRQQRNLQVGLVYPGNGVLGLGGGSVFGAYQQAWFEHYWNAYSCSIMFHELGHVMGYGHSSSFTYGPWAEQLMNNFYVNNLHQFPIDSSTYLNSKSNPYRYK